MKKLLSLILVVVLLAGITPENGSDDTRVCHTIDHLYEFFDLYKDR